MLVEFTPSSRKTRIQAGNSDHISEQVEFAGTLISIAKMTRALVAVEIAGIGLHVGQDELLVALDDHAEVSVSALADQLCVRPSTVSKMVDRLVEKDLAERTRSKSDTRLTMIRATPKSRQVKRDILEVRDRINQAISAQLDDCDRLLADMRLVEAAVKKRLLRLR